GGRGPLAGAESHRGGAAIRGAVTGAGSIRRARRRGTRTEDRGRQRVGVAQRVGQPRRPPLPQRRQLRHPPRDRPPPQLRVRPALLPRRCAGPSRRPRRARRSAPALVALDRRLRQRGPGAHLHDARLGEAPRRHGLTLDASLPTHVDELTAPWFSEVLGRDVTEATVLDTSSGTTGRARVALRGEADVPSTVFVKLPPFDAQQRTLVDKTGMSVADARFY